MQQVKLVLNAMNRNTSHTAVTLIDYELMCAGRELLHPHMVPVRVITLLNTHPVKTDEACG